MFARRSQSNLSHIPPTLGHRLNDFSLTAISQRGRLAVVGYFFCFLLIGVFTFQDYGVSFDETVSRTNGGTSLRYVLEKLNLPIFSTDTEIAALEVPLQVYRDRDYGVSFDLPAFFLERLLSLNDSRTQYLFRHLLTFLFFFAGAIAIYKLVRLWSGDWRFGLLASTILITSPRIYGEAFYNNKDIVFMSLVAVCLYTATRLSYTLSWRSALLHGAATALAITVRIPGLIFLFLTLGALSAILLSKRISLRQYLLLCVTYGLTVMTVTLAIWPWLWEAPVAHFLEAFRNMSRFRWNNYNLYFGQFVSAQNLPWHYASTWIIATTPILFILLAFTGIYRILADAVRSKLQTISTPRGVQELMVVAIATGPIFITGFMNSTLYDGWRQLYFVYPAVVLLAVFGAHAIIKSIYLHRYIVNLFLCMLAIQLFSNACWMIKWHPYQYLYFNEVISDKSYRDFEWDYWGVTNFDGLRYILDHDARDNITIAPIGATALVQSIGVLDAKRRQRISIATEQRPPDYLITNYRFYDGSRFTAPPSNYVKFHGITVDGREVLTIFKYHLK
jgi:hypothetical protein